jgi:hypothetical protein
MLEDKSDLGTRNHCIFVSKICDKLSLVQRILHYYMSLFHTQLYKFEFLYFISFLVSMSVVNAHFYSRSFAFRNFRYVYRSIQ